jgi:N-acetyl-anhydromuramyl-L-alanine amidase AmpD
MKRYGLTLADVTDHRTVSPGRKDDLAASELARFKAYLAVLRYVDAIDTLPRRV